MIDGGPSRTGRAGDRQPVYRQEAVRRQPEPVQQTHVEPLTSEASTPVPTHRPHSSKKSSKKLTTWLLTAALVVVAAFAVWSAFGSGWFNSSAPEIDTNKYQAVFLSGGQVYFGKLEMADGNYMRLSQVFYIQSNDSEASTNTESPTTDTSGMQLIKLGDEVHGPEDAMMINRDQILFFENLKSDGKVTQLIQQYSQGNN